MRISGLVFIFSLFVSVHSFSQQLSKEFVDSWVKSKDSTFKWDGSTSYIIGKEQYNVLRESDSTIDSALKTLRLSDLLEMNYVILKINPQPPSAYVIFVSPKRQMDNKNIEPQLRNAKRMLMDKPNAAKADYFLNNSRISMTAADNLINSIQIDDIYCLSVSAEAFKISYFDGFMKNGSIRIWTKKDK